MRSPASPATWRARERLRLVGTDPPQVGADVVLVRVHAAALNPADWHILRGDPLVAGSARVADSSAGRLSSSADSASWSPIGRAAV